MPNERAPSVGSTGPEQPYSHQSSLYPRFQHRGTHHPYPPVPGPYDDSLYTPTSKSSYSNRRGDGLVSYQDSTGRLGAPFLEESPGSMHVPMGEMISEIRRLSARVENMVEIQQEHTQDIARILGQFEKLEACMCALEGAAGDDEGNLPKKIAGSSKTSPNDHPVLKVSRCCLLAMVLRV